ncbi:MAG: hypothetical protein JWP01_1774 [Myxococcales bacterium]|nr:hypothetical protein [Myxococcales bacterium]
MRSWGSVVIALALAACGDDGKSVVDAPAGDSDGPCTTCVDTGVDAPFAPTTLADTGLCADAACTTVQTDVREYAPQYQLYADGSTKRRWIWLPPGTTIDTTDMNHWKFPVGTKVWKEFTRGTVRVETRFMTKLSSDDAAPGAWFYASYEWNAAQNATTLASPQMGVPDANGTQHDIPSRSNCRRCHEGVPGRVLGFQAISLDFAAPAGQLDLADAIAANLLSAPPSPTNGPYFPFPAAATVADRTAFGYLHANCGGCHNPQAPVYSALTSNMSLRLDVTKLGTVAMIPARATTVGNNGTVSGMNGPIVAPGNPGGSVMIMRMNSLTFPTKMPEIGTETTDPAGIAAITAWINQPP